MNVEKDLKSVVQYIHLNLVKRVATFLKNKRMHAIDKMFKRFSK